MNPWSEEVTLALIFYVTAALSAFLVGVVAWQMMQGGCP